MLSGRGQRGEAKLGVMCVIQDRKSPFRMPDFSKVRLDSVSDLLPRSPGLESGMEEIVGLWKPCDVWRGWIGYETCIFL